MLEVLDIMEGVMLVTEAPDFSGLDPETGKPWSPKKVLPRSAVYLTDEEIT